jgi:hypothetical protein
MCRVLKAAKILSETSHPRIKALCSGEIIWGNTTLSLFARTFAMILYKPIISHLRRGSHFRDKHNISGIYRGVKMTPIKKKIGLLLLPHHQPFAKLYGKTLQSIRQARGISKGASKQVQY